MKPGDLHIVTMNKYVSHLTSGMEKLKPKERSLIIAKLQELIEAQT